MIRCFQRFADANGDIQGFADGGEHQSFVLMPDTVVDKWNLNFISQANSRICPARYVPTQGGNPVRLIGTTKRSAAYIIDVTDGRVMSFPEPVTRIDFEGKTPIAGSYWRLVTGSTADLIGGRPTQPARESNQIYMQSAIQPGAVLDAELAAAAAEVQGGTIDFVSPLGPIQQGQAFGIHSTYRGYTFHLEGTVQDVRLYYGNVAPLTHYNPLAAYAWWQSEIILATDDDWGDSHYRECPEPYVIMAFQIAAAGTNLSLTVFESLE